MRYTQSVYYAQPMKKEHSELRRRPLLTPIWLAALIAIVLLALLAVFVASMTTTTVVLVRHAEKELGTIEDPPLTEAGDERAQALARMFGDREGAGRIAGVIVSDTRRSQRTAAPLAERLGIKPAVLNPTDYDAIIGRIRGEYRGRTVLIVGHSNTVPELARRLARTPDVPEIPDAEYGTIYVVTVPTLGRPSILRMTY
jgi:2,3-bisphosphoglycerate-dependent phosphoglycerate mutase